MNYYNEFDAKSAAWIRELIAQGLIPDGHVDERSIKDVKPSDLAGYTQCHFFCGIAGWSLALQLAGWPATRPIWTGSCPCQPFSDAGEGRGVEDERHLWPVWFDQLISVCRPPVLIGEQVASKAALPWLDGVFADLEGAGYSCGAHDLCSAGAGEVAEGRILRGDQVSIEPVLVGSPNIRQRLYWMAESNSRQRYGFSMREGCQCDGQTPGRQQSNGELECGGAVGRMANATSGGFGINGSASRSAGYADECGSIGRMAHTGHEQSWRTAAPGQTEGGRAFGNAPGRSSVGGMADSDGRQPGNGELQPRGEHGQQPEDGGACRMEHSQQQRLEGHAGHGDDRDQPRRLDTPAQRPVAATGGTSYWTSFDVLPCTDGKARRTQCQLFPLVDGLSRGLGRVCDPSAPINALANAEGRVMRLRGYGNAINSEIAAQFIRCCDEALCL